jgi:hypothetical protein
MATASNLKPPVQGFRPQYPWQTQFSLSQFRITHEGQYTILSASLHADLGCYAAPLDFTITSHVTGTTVLFNYFREARVNDDGDCFWAQEYTVARTNNGHLPDVIRLQKTLRARIRAYFPASLSAHSP